MDSSDSLQSIYRESIAAIRDYLVRTVGSVQLREREDFDRDGVILRTGKHDEAQFRVFISHEFLSDNDVSRVQSLLRSWRIADKAKALPKGVTLFLTTEGTFTERTEGPSLREAADTFDRVFGTPESLATLYDRVFSILVNGEPLGTIPAEMRGDPHIYSSFSDDFADVVGAVYLLDAAGYRNFEITTPHGSVDNDLLRVDLPTKEVSFLDFKRAMSPADRRGNAMREQINAQLRRALREDRRLQDALENRFVEVRLAREPNDKGGVDAAVSELREFAVTARWAEFSDRALVDFDAERFPVLSGLGAKVYYAQGVTHFSVEEGAKSFGLYDAYPEILRVIRTESSRTFTQHPVWLGISISDLAPLLTLDELMRARSYQLSELISNRFDEIIVGGAGGAKRYNRGSG